MDIRGIIKMTLETTLNQNNKEHSFSKKYIKDPLKNTAYNSLIYANGAAFFGLGVAGIALGVGALFGIPGGAYYLTEKYIESDQIRGVVQMVGAIPAMLAGYASPALGGIFSFMLLPKVYDDVESKINDVFGR